MPQEIRVPDFSKRLTTESGRIEHNNPGPGERTSIGPEDRAQLMSKVRKALTESMAPATMSPAAEAAATTEDVTASSITLESLKNSPSQDSGWIDNTVETPVESQVDTTAFVRESPESSTDETKSASDDDNV